MILDISPFGHTAQGERTRAQLEDCVLDIVSPYYEQPHRAYHTRLHIIQMFTDAHNLGWTLSVEEILAIAYHDIIWFASDDAASVKASAHMLIKHHEQGLLYDFAALLDLTPNTSTFCNLVDGAASAVRDTHKHFNHSDHFDSGRVIDLDMYGFSQQRRQMEIVENLSKEYGPGFQDGRVEFLLTMLKRKPFYYHLDDSYAKKAYTNILSELNYLMGDTDVRINK